MFIYLQLLKESFNFAIKSLRDNKLRTFLSLLGVTVGIFSIISVLAAVDSLNRSIQESLSGLDKNMINLSKYSFAPSSVPQWPRLSFPQVTYQEYEFLKRELPNTEAVVYELFGLNSAVKYGGKTIPSMSVQATSAGVEQISDIRMGKGRFYNDAEANAGTAVTILGYEAAEQLFGEEDPLDKEIRVFGRRLTVIGVLKKYGELGGGPDNNAYVTANFVRSFMNTGPQGMPSGVVLKPKKGVDMAEYEAVLRQKFRTYRGLKPEDIDYINVHGTSTPVGDISEAKAIKDVFGEHAYKLNISSTKSMTGHLLGAAGAVEALACVLSVKNDIVPPTINHTEGDNDEALDYKMNFTFNKAQKREVRAALSNTFGFGGHNCCVVFKKYAE